MIHATAIIDKSAHIGADVQIGPYAIIGPDCVIGDRCHIQAHAVLESTTLGADCQVFPGASLGLAPQHLGYKGEKTTLVVGRQTVFREGVTAHRGSMFDKGVTTIGDRCYFMALSHVAHDCQVGHQVILANGAQLAGHVSVGDNVFISGVSAVHQFVRIGQGAMVAGGSMVTLDVAPFCTVQGDRASIRALNKVGLRRNGAPRASLAKIKEAYKIFFFSGLSLQEALAHPALLDADAYVSLFRDFFASSKRGFTRPLGPAIDDQKEEILS